MDFLVWLNKDVLRCQHKVRSTECGTRGDQLVRPCLLLTSADEWLNYQSNALTGLSSIRTEEKRKENGLREGIACGAGDQQPRKSVSRTGTAGGRPARESSSKHHFDSCVLFSSSDKVLTTMDESSSSSVSDECYGEPGRGT